MKKHVTEYLTKAAEHNISLAQTHRDLAEHHHGLHKGMTADDHQHQIAVLHEVAAGYHADHAEHLIKMCRALADEPAMDTSVETHGDAFGSRDFRAAAGGVMDEAMRKRFFAGEPAVTVVAPSDESARHTAEATKNRLIGRDGQDPREELEKSAAPSELAHWF